MIHVKRVVYHELDFMLPILFRKVVVILVSLLIKTEKDKNLTIEGSTFIMDLIHYLKIIDKHKEIGNKWKAI